MPNKAGDRVNTNRRDAVPLARVARAGDLPAVSGPQVEAEAIRFPAPCAELALDDNIEFLIELVTPYACAFIGCLEIDIPPLNALIVVSKQAHEHIPLSWQ
jgi:hypothetical protein